MVANLRILNPRAEPTEKLRVSVRGSRVNDAVDVQIYVKQ